MTHVHIATVLAFTVLLAGCRQAPAEWRAIEPAQMSPEQRQQMETAEAARQELFAKLMTRLQTALGSEGAPAAIAVCRDEAPQIAEQVSKALGVTIGRTSFALRNAANEAPAWAADYIAQRRETPLFLSHSEDGALAALLPIALKAECVQCHGPAEAIALPVRDAIAAAYPADKATGFKEGDLRGWFHVLVPAAN